MSGRAFCPDKYAKVLMQSRKHGLAIGCFSHENIDKFSEPPDLCDLILNSGDVFPGLAYHEERRNCGYPNDTELGPDRCRY